MVSKTRLAATLLAGTALATALAGPAQAAGAPAAGKPQTSGWTAGSYSSWGACQAAGRQGQARRAWRWYECDQTWSQGRHKGGGHGWGDHQKGHHDDGHHAVFVLKVHR